MRTLDMTPAFLRRADRISFAVISHDHKSEMSISLKEHIDQTIDVIIHQYDLRGGSLRFYCWKLKENQNNPKELISLNLHRVVARQTIEKLNYETAKLWNSVITEYERSKYPNLKIDYDQLDTSGKQISTDEFLGYEYDWLNNKPNFKGKKRGKHWYFDFDKYEYDEPKRKLEDIGLKHNRGFVQSFFFPPYGMELGNGKTDAIKVFNDFIKILFDELSQLEIYSWSIDCSHFFEIGKEWWGSYFWTVYNPVKEIYVGIVASESD